VEVRFLEAHRDLKTDMSETVEPVTLFVTLLAGVGKLNFQEFPDGCAELFQPVSFARIGPRMLAFSS
jgi:hypothetical protein